MILSTSIKKKIIVTIIGTIFCLIICYKLAIKKTIVAIIDFGSYRIENQSSISIHSEIEDLKKRIERINDAGLKVGSDDNFRNDLVNKVIKLSNHYNIQVVGLNPPFMITNSNILVETNKFILCGSFIDQLSLLSKLESRSNYGKVVSVKFEKVLNHTTKKYELYGEYIIQNIKNR